MKKINDNIWLVEGSKVSFYGMPFKTRMTIIRLNSGALFIHSPVELKAELKKEVNDLGEVQFIVSPNKIHHLFMKEWAEAYPSAKLYCPPGLEKKRPDLNFYKSLSGRAEPEWAEEINQISFEGSCLMTEVVFFHKSSRTLILADLIENFAPNSLGSFHKFLAWFGGVLAPNGKTPLDFRLSFISRKSARASLKKILDWHPTKIIFSHGEWIEENGSTFLKRSFSWLL